MGCKRLQAAVVLLLGLGVLVPAASAAPVQLFENEIRMNKGNVTGLPWINPGSQELHLGGNLDLRNNNITNCDYIDGVDCDNLGGGGGGGTVSDVYVNESGDNMTGPLEMNGNTISGLPDPVGSSEPLILGFGDTRYLQRSGDSLNGTLDMLSHSIINVDSIGNGTAALAVTSNLDMQNNAIVDYFGSACPAGEAVVDIDNTGSFVCESITGGVSDLYVNESGDTMTGNLDLSGN
ncbi:MAG: hypothetical protein ABEJ62_01955, partial [Candidatus Nanohaloarchaea archaeon]